MNSNTKPSMRISLARVVNLAAKLTSSCRPPAASKNPKAPPAIDSSVLSVSSCRIKRPRPAPSAARIAISRSRRINRARVRFATLAQAISKTSPAVPSKIKNV
ncbi:MAG TPA: hypothetical protein VLG74_15070, partial [Blastocatellia bacterium]|nr:hypothetical protein [Blastocatellia bacterium]